MKKTVLKVLTAIIIIVAGVYVYFLIDIARDVKSNVALAQGKFNKSPVESLIALAESRNQSFGERNAAIWALGEIGEPKALPTLRQLQVIATDRHPCQPEMYICRNNLEKSIKGCTKLNAVKWALKKYR